MHCITINYLLEAIIMGYKRFKKHERYFADKSAEIVYFEYTQGTSSTQLR